MKCVWHCVCVCTSHVPLTWAGGAWGGRGGPSASTHQQSLLVFSQSLLGQVALPLDLQLQRFGDVRYDPVDGSQHEEHHMLEEGRQKLLIRMKKTVFPVKPDIVTLCTRLFGHHMCRYGKQQFDLELEGEVQISIWTKRAHLVALNPPSTIQFPPF